jgi:hypothetical protein
VFQVSKLKLHTRSFHPDRNFGLGGLGFKGDSRGFSDSTGVTSRIRHVLTIDLTAATVGSVRCRSDPSENTVIPSVLSGRPEEAAGQIITDDLKDAGVMSPNTPAPRAPRILPNLNLPPMRNDYTEARKQPRTTLTENVTPYRPDGDQTVTLTLTYAGQNFAFYGANTDIGHAIFSTTVPDLDVTHKFSMRIDRTLHSAHIISDIGGDGFPNCESFLIDDSDATCFLGTHIRIGTAATQLPGGRVLPMTYTMCVVDWTAADKFGSAFSVQIANDFTGDGSPQEIAPHGGTTRSAWNALHRTRNASGDWLRQIEDHVPTGRQTWRAMKETVGGWFE